MDQVGGSRCLVLVSVCSNVGSADKENHWNNCTEESGVSTIAKAVEDGGGEGQ